MITDTRTAIRSQNRPYVQNHLIGQHVQNWFEMYEGEFHWLDVCCGPGNALEELYELNFDDFARIRYYGYDVNHDYLWGLKELAQRLGISAHTHTGNLEDLRTILTTRWPGRRYHSVTLVNVLHELPLAVVPDLFLDLVQLCAPDGFVFVFDITSLPFEQPEYGAIPWTQQEIASVLDTLRKQFGLTRRIQITPWGKNQRSAKRQPAWYFNLRPETFPRKPSLLLDDAVTRAAICDELAKSVVQAFDRRLRDLDAMIEEISKDMRAATSYGKEPDAGLLELRQYIDMQLRDFWACYREVRGLRRDEVR